VTPILLSATLLLVSCGGGAKDRARLQELEKSITDELAAIRQEIAEAKLAPNDKVDIELEGSGPNTKIGVVDPPKKSSCRNPQANCGKEVRWTLRGALPQGWSVKIAEKADSPDKGCFAQPTFTANERHKSSGEPAESCRGEGASWSYSVTLLDQNGAPKSIVDPLIVMNWSP
jgi:hypothetical protein